MNSRKGSHRNQRSLYSKKSLSEAKEEDHYDEDFLVDETNQVQLPESSDRRDVRELLLRNKSERIKSRRQGVWGEAERNQWSEIMKRISMSASAISVVEAQDEWGWTPLMRASYTGALEVLENLLALHANYDHKNHWGWTSLQYASRHGHTKVVLALRRAGADVDYIDKRGESALSIAARYHNHDVQHGTTDIPSYLIRHCDIQTIIKAMHNEPLGMYYALMRLELLSQVGEYYMTSSLLYPHEHAFTSSNTSEAHIQRHSSVNTNLEESIGEMDEDLIPRNDESLIRRYSNTFTYKIRKLWERFFQVPEQSFYKVLEFELPISHCTSPRFLKSCVFISEVLSRPEVFDNDVIVCAVASAWREYGCMYHLGLFITYSFLMTIITFNNYIYHDWAISNIQILVTSSWILIILTILLNTIFVVLEIHQFIEELLSNRLMKYLRDPQNLLDWSAHILLYIATLSRIAGQKETYVSSSIMAIDTILLWFKFLYFLRPFRSTGPLIRMIFFIFNSVQELIAIVIIVLFGFSQALYLLSFENNTIDFSNVGRGMLTSFQYMIGGPLFDQFEETSNPALAKFLMCLFIFVTSILLLNLLIALMNNSYTTIRSKQFAEWNRERAKIMSEQLRFWSVDTKPYEYYLVRETDHLEAIETKESKTLLNIVTEVRELKEEVKRLRSMMGVNTSGSSRSVQIVETIGV